MSREGMTICASAVSLAGFGAAEELDEIRNFCNEWAVPFLDTASHNCFTRNLEKSKASQVVLCGGALEIDITQAAFTALVNGFSVFILVDQILSKHPKFLHTSLERLYQYGVCPILWDQFCAEVLVSRQHPAG